MNDKDNQDSDNLQENIDNEQNCFELLDGSSCFIASSETDVNLLRDFILESGATLKVTNGTETRNGRTYIYNIEQGSFRTRTDAVPTRQISNIHDRYPMDRDKVGVMHIFNGLHRDPANVLRFGATNDVKTFSETFRQIGFDVEIFQPDSFQEMKDLIRYVTKQNYEDYNIFALVFIAHGGQGKFYGPKTIYSRWNLLWRFLDYFLGSKEFILMQEVNQLLDDNISLKNRPKLIFTESCRGSIIDTQELLEYTSDLNTNLKPKNKGRHSEKPIANLADMFWACSTVEPYVSWSLGAREVSNSHSPWINKLCELLAQNHMHTDFQEIYRKLKCHFKWNPIHIKEEENMALLATFQMPDIQMDTLVGRVLFVKDEEKNGLEEQNEHQDKESDQEDPSQNQDQNKPQNMKDFKTKKETNINNEPKDKEETNINNEPKEREDEPKVEKEMEKFRHQNESKESDNFNDQNEYNELSDQNYKIETLSLGQTPGTELSQNSFQLNQDDVSKKTQNKSQKKVHLNPNDLAGARNLESQASNKKAIFRLPPEFNCYPMSKKIKGHALILCNEIFDHFNFPQRHGSEKDRENLDKLFCYLGFKILSYLNISAYEMKQRLLDLSHMDHTQDEMCIIVVMSHGNKDACFGSDGGSVKIDYILNIFNNANCPQLMGKPKLFLFQSCRGEQIDIGVEMATKARPSSWKLGSNKVPTWEDMLIVYASVPGFVSFRNTTEGTWFIDILCKVFMKHALDHELRDLLDLVMMEIRKKNSDGMEGAKQSCAYENRHFYKKLYFNPGLFKNENENN